MYVVKGEWSISMDKSKLRGMINRNWMGPRTLKTAFAVFLSAMICKALGFPVVFAVITAIVTLEPTASDSIKKGMVRFPASAIEKPRLFSSFSDEVNYFL